MNRIVKHIIIADDHILFIDGLKLLLKDEDEIIIDDIANDGEELLNILRHKKPDILLLDINMPKINGLEVVKYIKQAGYKIKIIMLSTYNERYLIEIAKQHKVNGYLIKNCSKAELLQTIQLVHEGYEAFPTIKSRIEDSFNKKHHFLKQFELTKRELEVLLLIKNNFTNQEIAGKLFLSIYTVDTHRKNIMHKLGLNRPSELLKFVFENNI